MPARQKIRTACWLSKKGLRTIKLYQCWQNMKRRCLNEKHASYHRYGGRGISVCEEWMDFLVFREWALSNGFRKGLTIDRIDNDGDYRPDNCRYATPKEQMATRVFNSPRGEDTYNAKLSEGQVIEIRKSKEVARVFANRFGVSCSTIWDIRRGKKWKHLL